MLPQRVKPELRTHLERVENLHRRDLAAGRGTVWLPGALARKYPNAEREWAWQWVWPSVMMSVDVRGETLGEANHPAPESFEASIESHIVQNHYPCYTLSGILFIYIYIWPLISLLYMNDNLCTLINNELYCEMARQFGWKVIS